MTNFFYFDEISKNKDSRAQKRFFVGSKKKRLKKIKSINDFSKSCPKSCKLGDNFFYFDKISNMMSPEPKNASFEGSKKARGKKSHQIK